jgi:hypothetical protein
MVSQYYKHPQPKIDAQRILLVLRGSIGDDRALPWPGYCGQVTQGFIAWSWSRHRLAAETRDRW